MSHNPAKKVTMKDRLKNMRPTRIIVLSFFLLIMLGTLLLALPISLKEPPPSFVDGIQDGFFTATSATCVTGLVIDDTYQQLYTAEMNANKAIRDQQNPGYAAWRPDIEEES